MSEKRTIRDYLLLNGIEVSGLKNPNMVLNKKALGLGKSDKRFAFRKFDVIDTEEKAYWLGFIFADGWVSSDGFNFELGLQAKDVGHLHKFNRFMECEDNNVKYHPKITETKTYDSYRWAMKSEHLWKALNNLGCVPKKSLILDFPKESIFKDPSLIRHFIRGYWDGDGCLCFTQNTHIVSVLGTKKFLIGLKKYVPNLQKANIYKRQNIYSIQKSCKSAYDILAYLYQDSSIHLDRKYEKYLDFCRVYGEPCILLETQNGEG